MQAEKVDKLLRRGGPFNRWRPTLSGAQYSLNLMHAFDDANPFDPQ